MKVLSLIFSLLLVGGASLQAQDSKGTTAETFEVFGNCGMCKRTIEKAAQDVAGVKTATWNPETGQLTVKFKAGKTTLEEIKKAVAASGYDTLEFRATDEAYNALHGCCQYERPPAKQ